MTFLGWLSDPLKGLSDLQLGDEKVTLNHLVESKSFDFRNFDEYFLAWWDEVFPHKKRGNGGNGPSWIEDFVVWHPRRKWSVDDHKWSTWYPKQPFFNGCLVKQPFFYVMIWNHPVETTIKNWLFGVPGNNLSSFSCHISFPSRFFGGSQLRFVGQRIVRFRSFKAFFGELRLCPTHIFICVAKKKTYI